MAAARLTPRKGGGHDCEDIIYLTPSPNGTRVGIGRAPPTGGYRLETGGQGSDGGLGIKMGENATGNPLGIYDSAGDLRMRVTPYPHFGLELTSKDGTTVDVGDEIAALKQRVAALGAAGLRGTAVKRNARPGSCELDARFGAFGVHEPQAREGSGGIPRLDREIGGGFSSLRPCSTRCAIWRNEAIGTNLSSIRRGKRRREIPHRRLARGRHERVRTGALRLARAAQDYVGARRLWPAERLRTRPGGGRDTGGVVCHVSGRALRSPVRVYGLGPRVLGMPMVSRGSRPEKGEWERRWHYFRRFIPRATAVIVPNEVGRAQVQRHFGLEDERVLCLPHPTPRFALEAADRDVSADALGQRGIRRPYLFYPAQFWAHKNHYGLLRGLAELRDRGASYELVLAGSDRGQRKYVERLIEEFRLSEWVHVLGFVETEQLIALTNMLTRLSI